LNFSNDARLQQLRLCRVLGAKSVLSYGVVVWVGSLLERAAVGQTTDTVRAWFKNITGVECPDRSRLIVNMFFNRGRLYLIQGINLPSTEDASFGPAALRFANSISFFAADGTRNFADTFR